MTLSPSVVCLSLQVLTSTRQRTRRNESWSRPNRQRRGSSRLPWQLLPWILTVEVDCPLSTVTVPHLSLIIPHHLEPRSPPTANQITAQVTVATPEDPLALMQLGAATKTPHNTVSILTSLMSCDMYSTRTCTCACILHMCKNGSSVELSQVDSNTQSLILDPCSTN